MIIHTDGMWFRLSMVMCLAGSRVARAQGDAAPSAGIEWDKHSLTLVAPGGGYARMIRTRDDDLLCAFSRGADVLVRRSADNGSSWVAGARITDYAFGAATNAELLLLRNGWILCSYNERPTDGVHPFAIGISMSRDGGRTWSRAERIYEADTIWKNGCWEPAAIQLPSGEIQLFFANESPYRTSGEQEITLLRSKDNGKTWSRPTAVSFRANFRDGMPVPLALKNHKGVVIAIEDAGFNGSLKPAIIHTTMRDNWRSGVVDGQSSRRWAALATPLPPEVTAAAPYIRQMPRGETILSVQGVGGGPMIVYVGDQAAHSFTAPSKPFEDIGAAGCWWNSLFIKDRETITAVSGTRIDGVGGIWSIDGRLTRAGRRMARSPRARRPATREAQKLPDGVRVVAQWNHRVDNGPATVLRFYSNGTLNDANGSATWTSKGRSLVLRWPNSDAPGGAWIDRVKVSADGRSYAGSNQAGNRISGTRLE